MAVRLEGRFLQTILNGGKGLNSELTHSLDSSNLYVGLNQVQVQR